MYFIKTCISCCGNASVFLVEEMEPRITRYKLLADFDTAVCGAIID